MIPKFMCNIEKLVTAYMLTEMSKVWKKVFAENFSLTLENTH